MEQNQRRSRSSPSPLHLLPHLPLLARAETNCSHSAPFLHPAGGPPPSSPSASPPPSPPSPPTVVPSAGSPWRRSSALVSPRSINCTRSWESKWDSFTWRRACGRRTGRVQKLRRGSKCARDRPRRGGGRMATGSDEKDGRTDGRMSGAPLVTSSHSPPSHTSARSRAGLLHKVVWVYSGGAADIFRR